MTNTIEDQDWQGFWEKVFEDILALLPLPCSKAVEVANNVVQKHLDRAAAEGRIVGGHQADVRLVRGALQLAVIRPNADAVTDCIVVTSGY